MQLPRAPLALPSVSLRFAALFAQDFVLFVRVGRLHSKFTCYALGTSVNVVQLHVALRVACCVLQPVLAACRALQLHVALHRVLSRGCLSPALQLRTSGSASHACLAATSHAVIQDCALVIAAHSACCPLGQSRAEEILAGRMRADTDA